MFIAICKLILLALCFSLCFLSLLNLFHFRVFYETRKIVGAMLQHITYNEWLPIILGPRVLEIFELKLLPRGYYRGYNDSVNPTISNAFAASAFRLFLLLVLKYLFKNWLCLIHYAATLVNILQECPPPLWQNFSS